MEIKFKKRDHLYKPENLIRINEMLKKRVKKDSLLKKMKDWLFKKEEPFRLG